MGFIETLIVELNGGGVGSDLEVELIGSAQRHYSIGCHEIKLILKRKFRSLYRSIAQQAKLKSLINEGFKASDLLSQIRESAYQRPLFIALNTTIKWWQGSRCRLTRSLQPCLVLASECRKLLRNDLRTSVK
jgi:hypothetical protein